MPRRRNSRGQYMRDRAERRMRRDERRRDRDYGYEYPMDFRRGDRGYGSGSDSARGRDRAYDEMPYMDYARGRDRGNDYGYDMRGEDYARRGVGRPRDSRRDRGDYRDYRDYRDYADDEYEEEYYEDLEKWTKKLKKSDRFGLSKEQAMQKAQEMGVSFSEYEPEEFYAVYLMQVSDYPTLANEPHTYLSMAKSWLEDKDIELDPSEKLCKYMYEIVMADED